MTCMNETKSSINELSSHIHAQVNK